ncbi:MAG: putative rane protein [Bacillota bacterium]|nr:putative rane protein [Bacillota bacterium]
MGDWLRHIVRFVVSALVLMFIGLIVPGFSTLSFVNALIAAAVITGLGYIIEAAVGRSVSPFGRGVVGFLVSAAVIYVSQFVVPAMRVTVLGALIAAFIIGLVDTFIPTTLR